VRSADRVTAVLLLVFSVTFAAGALKHYSWWGPGGPGSAFMPFWLGVVMAALSLFFLVRSLRSPWPGRAWLPRGEGLRSMLVVLGATVVFVALLSLTGMILGTALYLGVLIAYLGGHRWWITLGVAISAALVNWLVFVHWLRVPFPELGVWIF
jgi:putative tricarboxylic transport membrane protein